MSMFIEVPGQNGEFSKQVIIDLERFAFFTLCMTAGSYVIKFHHTKEDFVSFGFNTEEDRNKFYKKIRELLVIHI